MTPKLVVDRHLTDRPLGAVTSVVVVPKLVLLRLVVPSLDRQVVTPKLVEQLMFCAWAKAGKSAVSRRGTKMMCFIFVIEMVFGEPGPLSWQGLKGKRLDVKPALVIVWLNDKDLIPVVIYRNLIEEHLVVQIAHIITYAINENKPPLLVFVPKLLLFTCTTLL